MGVNFNSETLVFSRCLCKQSVNHYQQKSACVHNWPHLAFSEVLAMLLSIFCLDFLNFFLCGYPSLTLSFNLRLINSPSLFLSGLTLRISSPQQLCKVPCLLPGARVTFLQWSCLTAQGWGQNLLVENTLWNLYCRQKSQEAGWPHGWPLSPCREHGWGLGKTSHCGFAQCGRGWAATGGFVFSFSSSCSTLAAQLCLQAQSIPLMWRILQLFFLLPERQ